MIEQEKQLLHRAKELMARLPFDQIDVLVVDQMGKNISGTGMDTNVIGRIMFCGEPEPEPRKITRILVLDLTDQTHGNAVGIGLADFTTQKLVSRINHQATATNAITAMTPEKGRIPIALDTDRSAIASAMDTIGAVNRENIRLVHIKNTLELGEMVVSQAFMEEINARDDLTVMGELGPLSFNEQGDISPVVFLKKGGLA